LTKMKERERKTYWCNLVWLCPQINPKHGGPSVAGKYPVEWLCRIEDNPNHFTTLSWGGGYSCNYSFFFFGESPRRATLIPMQEQEPLLRVWAIRLISFGWVVVAGLEGNKWRKKIWFAVSQTLMKGAISINCFLVVGRVRDASRQSSYPGQTGRKKIASSHHSPSRHEFLWESGPARDSEIRCIRQGYSGWQQPVCIGVQP
jgi:hypothetical protein